MLLLNSLIRSRRAAGAGLCLSLFLLSCAPARAGRPLTVEDAAIVDPGQCQLETYAAHARSVNLNEFWATPACNVGGDWELAFGVDAASDAARRASYGRLQAKTVFKPLEAGGWGVGLVLADQFRAGRQPDGDLSLNVPLSFSLFDDRVLLHLNAGLVRMQVRRATDLSWGVGAEFRVSARHTLTAETFGQQRYGGRYQFGYAYALIPDHLQIDASWGQRLARRSREPQLTLGLVLQN